MTAIHDLRSKCGQLQLIWKLYSIYIPKTCHQHQSSSTHTELWHPRHQNGGHGHSGRLPRPELKQLPSKAHDFMAPWSARAMWIRWFKACCDFCVWLHQSDLIVYATLCGVSTVTPVDVFAFPAIKLSCLPSPLLTLRDYRYVKLQIVAFNKNQPFFVIIPS